MGEVTPSPPTETTLSHLLRTRVRSADGTDLGRIRDVRTVHHSSGAITDSVLVAGPRGKSFVLPWSLIGSLGADDTATVLVSADEARAYESARESATDVGPASALWLGRDVLDSQVVDLAGSRLARVSEIVLVVEDGPTLAPSAVDLGFGAVLSRVGLGLLGRRMASSLVRWDDLYLASDVGHRVEITVSADRLQRHDARTVAEIVARVRMGQAAEVLQAIEPSQAASALSASHRTLRPRLMRSLPHRQRAAVVAAAPTAMAAELRKGSRGSATGGRRFLRTAGWRVRRPPRSEP